MKILYSILIALLLAMPAMAITDEEASYLRGLDDGYKFGYAALAGQDNATWEAFYNSRVADLNAWMDQIGYNGSRWDVLHKAIGNYELPVIFTASLDEIRLMKPYVAVNNSADGIVHQIDGSSTNGTKYTTNDMNALPDKVTQELYDKGEQGAYLGGI